MVLGIRNSSSTNKDDALLDRVNTIAASTAAATVAAMAADGSLALVPTTPSSAASQVGLAAILELRSEMSDLRSAVRSERRRADSEMQALRSELEIARRDLEEVRDWETVRVEWNVTKFESRLRAGLTSIKSSHVRVAGKSMGIEIQVETLTSADERHRRVGCFVVQKGGSDWTPVRIGRTNITFQSNDPDAGGNLVNNFAPECELRQGGLGRMDMTTLGALRDDFLDYKDDKQGVLRVEASIRVAKMSQYPRWALHTVKDSSSAEI